MNLRIFFYTISIFGFFFPYFLKFLITNPNDEIKIFAIYSLSKFNLVYFTIIIVFFFLGLIKKFKFLRITQIIFISLYFSYILIDYFIITKQNVENYIKTHDNTKLIKITELKKYSNYKIYYKKGIWAAIETMPKKTKKLPFNYQKHFPY